MSGATAFSGRTIEGVLHAVPSTIVSWMVCDKYKNTVKEKFKICSQKILLVLHVLPPDSHQKKKNQPALLKGYRSNLVFTVSQEVEKRFT